MDNQTRDCSSVVTEVWDKVMFLHLSVILFTRAVGFPTCITGHMTRGVCIQGGFDGPPPSTMGYGQQVGGMHPTGMHSCLWNM